MLSPILYCVNSCEICLSLVVGFCMHVRLCGVLEWVCVGRVTMIAPHFASLLASSVFVRLPPPPLLSVPGVVVVVLY